MSLFCLCLEFFSITYIIIAPRRYSPCIASHLLIKQEHCVCCGYLYICNKWGTRQPAAGDAARAMRGSSDHNRVKKESSPAPLFFLLKIKLTLPGIAPWKGRPTEAYTMPKGYVTPTSGENQLFAKKNSIQFNLTRKFPN